MGKIFEKAQGLVNSANYKWGWFITFMVLLIIGLGLLIACQTVEFSDPMVNSPGFTIWGCNESEDCTIIKSSSIMAIISLIFFLIFSPLYWFKVLNDNNKAQTAFVVLSGIFLVMYILFQSLSVEYINQQIENKPQNLVSSIGWELMISGTVITLIALVLSPFVLSSLLVVVKNFIETMEELPTFSTPPGPMQPFVPQGQGYGRRIKRR